MHFTRKIMCLISITIISLTWCFGHNNFKSDNKFGWVNLGFGGSRPITGGFSAGINGSYQIGYHIISLRAISNQEIGIWGIPEYNNDIGLLYGLSAKKKIGFASISTGISRVGYNKIKYSNEMHYTTIGIPIEIQLFLTAQVIGIGIYGFANLNPESSFVGVLVSIQLGKLR